MDRQARNNAIAELPKRAIAMTGLASIAREYTLAEIAIMTRAAPARLLGLADRGHLGRGARADVAVYRRRDDKAEMFRSTVVTIKAGTVVVRDGTVVATPRSKALVVKPGAGTAISRHGALLRRAFGLSPQFFHVDPAALGRDEPFMEVPCRS